MAFHAFNFGRQLGLVGNFLRLPDIALMGSSISVKELTESSSPMPLSAVAESACKKFAEGSGMRLLAEHDCPIPDKDHPICIQAVYASEERKLPNGECILSIKVCYVYSYEYLNEWLLKNFPLRIDVIVGNGQGYEDGTQLAEFLNMGSVIPTYTGENFDEWTISFWIAVGPNSNYDTIFIGSTGPSSSSEILWDRISIKPLTCDIASNPESNDEVKLGKTGHDCDTCYFWLENMDNLNGWIIEVKNRFGTVVYSEEEPKKPVNGTKRYITLPCKELYDGAVVDVTDYSTKQFKRIVVPPYWNINSPLKQSSTPKINVVPRPLPGEPCRYEIDIFSSYKEKHKIWLFDGLLSKN